MTEVDDPNEPKPTEATTGSPTGESANGSVLGDAGGALGSAVVGLARVLFRRGRVEARKAASIGRLRLDLRQLSRDRDAMYAKLGREARHLVEGGEIDHPGMRRGVERISELDLRIEALQAELLERGEAVAEPSPDQEPSGDRSDDAPPAAD